MSNDVLNNVMGLMLAMLPLAIMVPVMHDGSMSATEEMPTQDLFTEAFDVTLIAATVVLMCAIVIGGLVVIMEHSVLPWVQQYKKQTNTPTVTQYVKDQYVYCDMSIEDFELLLEWFWPYIAAEQGGSAEGWAQGYAHPVYTNQVPETLDYQTRRQMHRDVDSMIKPIRSV